MKAFRLTPALCPHCGYTVDAASAIEGTAGPTAGDLTLCLSCAGEMVFDAALVPRKPAPGEMERVCKENPEVASDLAKVRAAILGLDSRPTPAPAKGLPH